MSRRPMDVSKGTTFPVAVSDTHSSTTTTTSRSRDTEPKRHLRPIPPPQAGPSTSFSQLHLAPATRTSVVTTTTVTTVQFAPILVPRSKGVRPCQSSFSRHPRQRAQSAASRNNPPLTPKSSFARLFEDEEDPSAPALRLDPKLYPLSQAPWPGGIQSFKLTLGEVDSVFYEDPEARKAEGEGDRADASAASRDAANPAERSGKGKGKGKGKERATGHSLGASIGPGEQPASTSLPRPERGAHAQRRRSRRSRPVASLSGAGDAGDAASDDDDEPRRPRMSLDMDSGVDMGPSGSAGARLPSPGPPRKRPRGASRPRGHSSSVESDVFNVVATAAAARESSMFASGVLASTTAATLPSPNMSPPSPVPTFVGGEDGRDCRDDGDDDNSALEDVDVDTEDRFDLGSGKELSALLSLPDFVNTFDQLSPALQSYFIFTFLKRSSIPVLQTINNIIAPSLRRDFLTDLPPELGVQILGYLDAKTLCRASLVCKGWRRLVDGEWRVWKERLVVDALWVGDGSEEREAKEIVGGSKENLFLTRWKAGVWDSTSTKSGSGTVEDDGMRIDGIDPARRFSHSHSVRLASPSSSREASPFSRGHFTHPFKTLYRRRFVTRQNWAEKEPTRVAFACHANNVVTCLQFDKHKVVSASDDHSINVFDTQTGVAKARLSGHEGGVWALQYIGNILVSGSTDRTVRVWDLDKAKCTHVFVGHTSTVRCLQIVEPENINSDPNGEPIWEPPYPLIVTGSRDWSLRVWRLPSPDRDPEYHPTVPMSPTEENTDPTDNPFHLRHLAGHRHAVRALAAHGRTLVSGSYDCQVRVWDMLTGECKHRLTGHSQKVYSVVFDHIRKQCASGSMDGTVRLWSTETGECKATLEGHSSLVGLLGLSFRHLVSAAADSTLRIWDPATGECRHTLAAHSGAITCFQHDEAKVISGSDGTLKMWDVRDGTFTRDLLTGLTGVWQVSFDQRFCVAAVQRNGQSEFEILDFGAVDDEDDVSPRLRNTSDERAVKFEDDDDVVPGPSPSRSAAPSLSSRPSEAPRPSHSRSTSRAAGGSASARLARRTTSLRIPPPPGPILPTGPSASTSTSSRRFPPLADTEQLGHSEREEDGAMDVEFEGSTYSPVDSPAGVGVDEDVEGMGGAEGGTGVGRVGDADEDGAAEW